ncbi:MAG: hypothetical protein IKM43_04065 [Clostridia bacterium]|nr:hypothetical protein [Clostridia bacterium]
MERALEIFLDNFLTWRRVVVASTSKAKKEFEIIKEKIESDGPTKELMFKLFSIRHDLFQSNYLFMESKLSLHNIYHAYPDNLKAQIDTYEDIYNKANKVIGIMYDYEKSLKNENEKTC